MGCCEDALRFGQMLCYSRSKIDLTRPAVAKMLGFGLKIQKIAGWERGDFFPKRDDLQTLAKVYQVDLIELARVYDISVEGRKLEKLARRSISKKTMKRDFLSGAQIGSGRIVSSAVNAPRAYRPVGSTSRYRS